MNAQLVRTPRGVYHLDRGVRIPAGHHHTLVELACGTLIDPIALAYRSADVVHNSDSICKTCHALAQKEIRTHDVR